MTLEMSTSYSLNYPEKVSNFVEKPDILKSIRKKADISMKNRINSNLSFFAEPTYLTLS
jgi:hypothetical protein